MSLDIIPWVKTLLTSSVLAAVLGGVVGLVLDYRFKRRWDADLERLKADLTIAVAEHGVRFSKLHEKRLETIERLYGLLWPAHRALSRVIAPSRDADDEPLKNLRQTVTTVSAWWEFLTQRRIYLDKTTCRALDEYFDEMLRLLEEMQSCGSPQELRTFIGTHQDALNSQKAAIAELAKSIEDKFRALIEEGNGAGTGSTG